MAAKKKSASKKKSPARKKPPIIVLYGVPINEAIKSGNLSNMKAMAKKAEAHLKQASAIQAALTKLKAAIAKASGKK